MKELALRISLGVFLAVAGCSPPPRDDVVQDVTTDDSAEAAALRAGTAPAPTQVAYPGNKLGRYGDCYLYAVQHGDNTIYVTGSATGSYDNGCAVAVVTGTSITR